MNAQSIQCFLAVTRHHSFTKAANELFMTQPAVSSQIAKLEHECHTKLFIRNYHQVELSPAGKRLKPFFRQLNQDFTNFNQALQDYHNSKQPQKIKIGLYFSDALAEILQQIDKFNALNPNIQVVVNNYVDILHELEQGSIDIGLEMIIPNQKLNFQPQILDEFSILRGDAYLHGHTGPLSLSSLQDATLFVLHSEGNTGGMKKIRDQILGASFTGPAVEFNSMDSLLANLKITDAFALIPFAVLPSDLTGIQTVPIKDPRVPATFKVGWGYQPDALTHSPNRQAIQQFLDYFHKISLLNLQKF
ncbi:LysR family transcriptional regulator [Levilactobacillus namurensis]|uniref:LysR family transcriptional regulator n=1 Tax=Levilactobacillus namurensis TaxID=380393 RepID=UPI0026F22567|nr:LysR family transcriptional regulator [Levilactobacillus namurensis]